MAYENIITSVESLKLFSTKNIAKLKGHEKPKDFLMALISIYENNIKNYLEGTAGRGKKLSEVIDYAYAAFYKTARNNSFFSAVLFLKEQFPDLAISLGLAAENNLFEDQIKSVFIAVLSRHLIFSHLAGRELREICLDPEVQNTLLFPAYLFNAYLLQSQTAEHPEFVFPSLCGQFFYISQVLAPMPITAELKGKYFGYLESTEKTNEFIQAVAGGYSQKIPEAECKDKIERCAQKILDSEVKVSCAPTLVFVGIKTASSVEEAVSARLAELSRALNTVEANKALIDREAERLRGEAVAQADAIRNRKTVWTVGFGTGMGTPNIGFGL